MEKQIGLTEKHDKDVLSQDAGRKFAMHNCHCCRFTDTLMCRGQWAEIEASLRNLDPVTEDAPVYLRVQCLKYEPNLTGKIRQILKSLS